jgi:hypothetical protein
VFVTRTKTESTTVNAIEQARFNPLYKQMLQALKLQGKRPKTIEAYSRAVRRIADFFNRCPDTLGAAERVLSASLYDAGERCGYPQHLDSKVGDSEWGRRFHTRWRPCWKKRNAALPPGAIRGIKDDEFQRSCGRRRPWLPENLA